jgi:hypothetical protein
MKKKASPVFFCGSDEKFGTLGGWRNVVPSFFMQPPSYFVPCGYGVRTIRVALGLFKVALLQTMTTIASNPHAGAIKMSLMKFFINKLF